MNDNFIIPLNGLASGESRFSWHAAKEFFDSFENAEILDADLYFMREIGLQEHLSPTRSNGLLAMIKQMRVYALAYKAKQAN